MTDIVTWARDLPARAGHTRVIAIDGRSRAGKSTLATALADGLAAPLIRMDELYPGWDGLTGGVDRLREWVLAPLAEGRHARWRRWDWTADRYAEWHETPATGHLVVEGVGCGARVLSPYVAGLVWVRAPAALRRSRALARDGESYAPHWERWASQEEAFYATENVQDRADHIIHTGVTT